jgi:hypothetical protein
MRVAAVCVVLFTLSCASGSGPAKTISGWVSDASCGAAHVGGKNPECVTKCLKGGAHIGHPEWTAQAMVIVVDGSESLMVVDNPEKLTGREAQHVIVRAKVAGDHMRVVEVLR